MRVVLDTNVLISALLFKGRLSRLYEAIEYRDLTLCFTEATFAEFIEVIHRKKFISAFRRNAIPINEVIELVRRCSLIKPTPTRIPSLISEDPFDNHILAAARMCDAVCIVSGNRHINRLSTFENIPILTPKQFLEVL